MLQTCLLLLLEKHTRTFVQKPANNQNALVSLICLALAHIYLFVFIFTRFEILYNVLINILLYSSYSCNKLTTESDQSCKIK